MSEIKNFVGIDISKGWLDFAATTPKSRGKILEFRLDNNPKDLKTLKSVLKKGGITMGKKTLVTFEHIGTYSRPLVKYLMSQQCQICQETALKIKNSLGIQREKTDKIDAKRIMEYSIRNIDKLNLLGKQNPAILHLKELVTMRERFRKIEVMLKNPVKDKLPFLTKKYVSALNKIQSNVVKQMKIAVVALEDQIKKTMESDKDIGHKLDLITSIPNIGVITAANLVCYTRNFTAFTTGRQLASYAGCVPFRFSSGISVKRRAKVSQIANKKLKALIHLAAIRGIRKNSEFQKYYERKVKEGKHKMSVLNAIRCKILLRVAAVVKRDQPYIKQSKYLKIAHNLKNKNVSAKGRNNSKYKKMGSVSQK